MVRVTWLPYELHPEAPAEGIPREAYFGKERSERMSGHLQAVASEVSLAMESRDVIINSRRALGAAEFAREQGRFEEMHHALFKAHWEKTARLEDVDDLVRVGESVGLEPDELRSAIEDQRYGPVIDEHRRVALSVGIDAIPAHVFGRRFLILGAQPYEVFQQVIARLNGEATTVEG